MNKPNVLPKQESVELPDYIPEQIGARQHQTAEVMKQEQSAQMAEESLRRMQDFPNREEQFIATVRKSKS